jgi:hypothetical protein
MTFEKALEAMKQGKEVLRGYWKHNSDAVIGIDTNSNGESRVYIRHTNDVSDTKRDLLGGSCDIVADDWEIYEPKTWYNSVKPGYNCRCEINPDILKNIEIESGKALHEWIEKAGKRAEEHAKQCKPFETYKEEPAMYTDLEITFKSGETLTYKDGEWDDYSYDGKSVAVKKSCTWVGIYNFDNVFCVELKKREE